MRSQPTLTSLVIMNRALALSLVLAAAAPLARAQATATVPEPTPTPAAAAKPAPDTSSLIMAPAAKDSGHATFLDSDGENRSVSPGLAAALSAGLPKYSPPTPTPTPNQTDLRDVDKPKNEIKRLPKYEVIEKRPPIFRPKDLFTPANLADLYIAAHPGLNFGNVLGLNNSAAYEMYLEEERLANIADLTDTAHAMMLGGDKTEGQYILQATQDTYMRVDDNWHIAGPTTNAPGSADR